MPPADYRTMHKGTDVSQEETTAVCAWSQKVGSDEDSDQKHDDGHDDGHDHEHEHEHSHDDAHD
jgi:hypothetical protein